jgi:hypothetical protein
MRPTAEHIREEEMPDEMMIDWGNLPAGSTATLYLPGVDTKKIIERSHKLYGYTKLTETEEYTLQFPARGISYLPIPKHEGKRLFALLSVELPLGIVKGQSFQVIVRQLTGKVRIEDGYHHYKKGWRTTLGTFQITINVQKKEEMLKPEEGLLSIFRLIKKGASKKGAWYPLLKKYTEHIAYRVNALGGKAASIKPYVPVIFHGPKKR